MSTENDNEQKAKREYDRIEHISQQIRAKRFAESEAERKAKNEAREAKRFAESEARKAKSEACKAEIEERFAAKRKARHAEYEAKRAARETARETARAEYEAANKAREAANKVARETARAARKAEYSVPVTRVPLANEKFNDNSDAKYCKACMDNAPQYISLSCRHFNFCHACAITAPNGPNGTPCPTCRVPIKYLRVYV